jgi:DNA-binding SARP family transcriptional activator
VLWIDASDDSFCGTIRSGTLSEHLDRQRIAGLARFSLIIFDDLPSLNGREADYFSDWVDHLIEEDSEVIVITTPHEDCLCRHQSDRLLIDGSRLVSSQRWNRKRVAEVLSCFFEAPAPQGIAALVALMILMGCGIVDNLRELGYPIAASTPALLKNLCPLVKVDERSGSFDVRGFPIAELRAPLLAQLNEVTRAREAEMSDLERCFERLTQLSVYLFERSQREQSQLLLELAGSLLAHDDAGFPLDTLPVVFEPVVEPASGPEPIFSLSGPESAPALEPALKLINDPVDSPIAPTATAASASMPGGEKGGDAAAWRNADAQQSAIAKDNGRAAKGSHTRAKPRKSHKPSSKNREPEPVVVRLFGGFEIFKGGRRIEGENIQRSRVRALMIHLALNMGCGISRDTLIERIWPGKESARAKENFYATWSRLSHLLADEVKPSPYVTNSQGLCRLEPSAVTTDVWEFELLSKAFLFEQGSVDQRVDAIYRMEQLYRGDILSGYQIDPHIQAAQQRYRSILVDVMLEASKLFSQEGNDTNAVWFARRAYDTDPTREDVYRILMAMQDRAGQRTNALKTYFDCKRYLSEELGILPSQKTTALYQELILDRR